MTKKRYDFYQYIDPDFEYTYSSSSVLKNKFGIEDKELALKKEYQLVAERLLELGIKPIFVHSMQDVKVIHKLLFQDMYDWAGEYRKVNISKSGNTFMAMQSFDTGEEFMNSLFDKYHKKANMKEEVAVQLSQILDNLNYMHPFREGNGRAQREVLRALAFEKGFDLLLDIENNDEVYNRYMDGTVYKDVLILEKLFLEILDPI